MLSATLYVSACTAKNRLRRWLLRLREPRYLIGVLLACAYFYVSFGFRRRVARGGRRRRSVAIYNAFPSFAGLVPLASAGALLAAAAGSWLVPTSGRLLEFTEPEVQFLFTAPIHRRALLLHRLLRSQGGLFFAALVPSLAFSIPLGSPTLAIRSIVSIWILLVTARVYFSAVALSRSHLTSADPKLRRLARLPLVAVLVALAVVLNAAARGYSSAPAGFGIDELASSMTAAFSQGAARVVLWPFLALAAPFFAAGWPEYFAEVAQSALIAVAAMGWLIALDEVFQGASMLVEEGRDTRPAAKASYAVRSSAWKLAPEGRPEGAFVWKTTMQMLRVVDKRVFIRFLLILIILSILVVVSSRTRGLAGVAGVFALFGAVYTILLAPQILRLDMRQDLQHLELMKTWPVRGSAVIRGELGGPAIALTCALWLLIALALMFSGAAFPQWDAGWRVAVAAGAALVGPALIFGQYMIHNGMAVVLPGWIPLGSGRPRGLDAMGQRLLLLGATWIALGLMLLPGAIVSGILWLAFYRVIGAAILAVTGAVCAVFIALETLMMSEALGPAYDRLDLLAIERPE